MTKKNVFVLLFLFLLFIPNLFMASSTHPSRGKDFRAFTTGCDRLLARHYLYEGSKPGSSVTWPPFLMVFMAPWALLAKADIHTAQTLWYCANCLLFFLTIGLWCRLVHGRGFGWFDRQKPLSFFSPFVFLPLLLAAGPLLDNASELQINIVLLFIVSLGIYEAEKNRELSSGFWFGMAAAIKAYPLIFIVFLLFRRKFRAAAMMSTTAAVLTLLPVLWYGPYDYYVNLKGWLAISLHGGYPLSGSAQSVYSMLGRWLTSDLHTMLFGKVVHPPLDTPGSIATMWLHRGLFVLVLGGFYGTVFFRRYRSGAFEGAFVSLVMILFSPIAWKHYWVMCFPALFVLWDIALTGRAKVVTRLLWLFFILVPGLEIFGSASPLLKAFANHVVSNYTLGGIALLAAMVYWAARVNNGRTDTVHNADVSGR